MDRRQTNKFNMYTGVARLTKDPKNQAAIQAVPVFASEATAFQALLPRMQKASKQARLLTTTGVTETTEAIREELADTAAAVSGAVEALAKANQDAELSQTAHVTRSMIAYGRANDAAEIADNLLAAALARAGSLGPYGLDQSDLNDFDDLIQAFSDRIGHPRATINKRKSVRATLPELFEKADEHLAQMDRLSEVLNRIHPEFVSEYRLTRRIVHTAATHTGKDDRKEGKESSKTRGDQAQGEQAKGKKEKAAKVRGKGKGKEVAQSQEAAAPAPVTQPRPPEQITAEAPKEGLEA